MTNLGNIIRQLQNDREHAHQQLQQLDKAISTLAGLAGHNGSRSTRGGARHMSASARNRIAAAQRARWAKWHRQHGAKANGKAPAKRIVSAASRRKMAAAQRARWAKVRKAA